MKELICCGQPVAKSQSKATKIYTIACLKCGKSGAGSTAEIAERDFESTGTTAVAVLAPTKVSQLPAYMASRMSDLREVAVPFLSNDRPALTRLVKNNVRYVMLQKTEAMNKVWQTPEGQESIVHAMEEALSLGSELGKTGSLVPFGGTVEFIPAIEAYEFALTNGANPPFGWVQIDMIHENDISVIQRVNGEFACSVKPGRPRGDLLQVAVYGHSNRLRHVIGEVYDVDRLLEKARVHSTSYQYYLQDKAAFEMARTEGKLKVDGGREYVEKTMHKRGGDTWIKKIFGDDITNPYEGADQPEMLRKAAGKSFLGKYARVRNSEAAMDEVAGEPDVETVVEASIDAAFSAFDTTKTPPPKAAPEPDPDPEPEPEPDEPTDAELAEELGQGEEPEEEEAQSGPSLMDQVKAKVGAKKEAPVKEELDIF